MRESCTPLSCCFAHPFGLSRSGDGMWGPTVLLQAKQLCLAGTQPGDGSTGCPSHAEVRDAALRHLHHVVCPLLTKFNPILPLDDPSCKLASPLVPMRRCSTHSIPSSEHASAVHGVTSLCPVPLGHTCQDLLNACLRPRWPPTSRPAQPANHPSCAVPPQRGPMLIKHEAETTKYVKTHLKFIVSYHTFESLERRPVFLPLRDGAYLLSPTLCVYV